MLTVKASVKPSSIQGIGLFADEDILKGTVIWKFDPRFDLYFDPKEVEQMPSEQRELLLRYAYLSTTSGKYVYSIDDSRFTNNSSKHHNVDEVALPADLETSSIANRDIRAGEELLDNYRAYDAHDANGTDAYLDR